MRDRQIGCKNYFPVMGRLLKTLSGNTQGFLYFTVAKKPPKWVVMFEFY